MTDLHLLRDIERRILWLATAMVHHANRVRPNPSGVKVGGHQASSASMTTIMTALWFHTLTSADRVSVKPHASPVLHAINFLLGELDASYLPRLRELGGLQSYPSRTKDPDPVDFSTGSVGIGATAPIWAAIAARYLRGRFGVDDDGANPGRQYALIGDAELDEGAIWEAVLDPMVAGLGEVTWIVDLNRQSLDRVVPNAAATRMQDMFAAAGWQVITVKYGRLLETAFAAPGGDALRGRIDTMDNPEYQRLLRCTPAELRARLTGDGPEAEAIRQSLEPIPDLDLVATFGDLGGHDLGSLTDAFDQIDDSRPTVIIAYTVKGHGLPTAGHPQNHSSLLTTDEFSALAVQLGMDESDPWTGFALGTGPHDLCRDVADRLRRADPRLVAAPVLPTDFGRTPTGRGSTQAALGKLLLDLSRHPDAAARVVTVAPDVSTSTNLAGWVNKVGVWSAHDRTDWFADDAATLMRWHEHTGGQHVELGIAETNLVGLLGELGSTWSRQGQPLLPIGVVYDPFVERALEPWSFGIYAGGQSILVGTPSGVSLAAEGGAHQSISTPSVGIEQAGCVAYEPAFGIDLEWTMLAALGHLGRADGESAYFRLSTIPIDQTLAAVPDDPAARERRRRQAVAGGYMLRWAANPTLTIVAAGVVIPEALAAAERLADQGVDADVVCVTSADLLFRAVQARRGRGNAPTWLLEDVLPAARARPMVTVLDGHPHTLAFLPALHGVPAINLGVSRFGQSGSLADVYRYHGLDADSILRAGLDLV